MADLNKNTCGSCIHFDSISARSIHGWCADRSTYPAQEQGGQQFPAGVKRAALGEPGKPIIVTRLEVVTNCTKYRAPK